MASLIAGNVGAIDLTAFDIVEFTSFATHVIDPLSNEFTHRLLDAGNPNTYNEFNGFGFNDDGNLLNQGIVNSIDVFEDGELVYRITALNFDAALLAGFIASPTGSQDFLGTLFAGGDVLNGTTLGDHLLGYSGNDTMNGDEGGDRLEGGIGNDILNGDEGNDTLFGGDDNDNIDGDVGNDSLEGDDGNDTLDGGLGADSMDGGEGNDTYEVDDKNDVTSDSGSSANTDTDTVRSSIDHTLDLSIENLDLTGSGNIKGTGNATSNVITGNSGNNTLEGKAGNDTMRGGSGNDVYIVDSTFDQVKENAGEGFDVVQTTADFELLPNIENLVILSTGTVAGTGNDSNNTITGGDGANKLDGKAGNDTLLGGNGSDTLIGGTGSDRMEGGAGDDEYHIDSPLDIIIEASSTGGIDTVVSTLSHTLFGNFENLTLVGSKGLVGTGNSRNNILIGGDGNDSLFGGNGFDTLEGGAGNDTLDGGSIPDDKFVEVLRGGKGDDTYIITRNIVPLVEETVAGPDGGTDTVKSLGTFTLGANIENLILTDTDNDNGTGNDLNNQITGGSGSNRLDGKGGDDTLVGNGGDDVFVVDSLGDKVSDSSGLNDEIQSSVVLPGTVAGIEHYTFLVGATPITFTGTTAANRITSADGADSLVGGLGNDTLDGGKGNDTLDGGAGKDSYVIDSDGDVITDTGADIGDTVLSTKSVDLTLLRFTGIENATLIGADETSATGNASANVLTGNTRNNLLLGDAGNDTLNGGDGEDSLDGGVGADSMAGGKGNDLYFVDNLGDKVTEDSDGGVDTVRATFSYALGLNLDNLTLLGTGNFKGTGNVKNNVITGNEGHNTLDGGLGNDLLQGGIGNDVYIVDSGDDNIVEAADSGYDIVKSSSKEFTLDANVEELQLTGTAGIAGTGNDGKNLIIGNSGANKIDGGLGNDTLRGGTGNDFYVVDVLGDVVEEAATGGVNDTIFFAVENKDFIKFYSGIESYDFSKFKTIAVEFTGDDFGNGLTGGSQNDTFSGGKGNDTLDGRSGNDSLTGGVGNDTYVINSVDDKIVELAGGGIDTVVSQLGSYTLQAEFENLTIDSALFANDGKGNSLNNVITGNNDKNKLEGVGGNDTIIGDSGDDTLDGGLGNDSMAGGTGADYYILDSLSDRMLETFQQGTDTVETSFTFTLALHFENLVLTGDKDVNGTGTIDQNTLTGNDKNNKLDGRDGVDTLIGNGGNDTLIGGTGIDIMRGGAGDDQYFADQTADTVFEDKDAGIDTVFAALVTATNVYSLTSNVENLTFTGSRASQGFGNELDNRMTGGSGNDTLNGGLGKDTLDGGIGADSMVGAADDDVYIVDNLKDIVEEFSPGTGGGIDTIQAKISLDLATFAGIKNGGIENLVLLGTAAIGSGDKNANTLTGNASANTLSGREGNDTLHGDAGNDTLDGGTGNDSMVGGIGNDTFLVDAAGDKINEAAGGGTDTVKSMTASYSLSDNVENLILLAPAVSGTGNSGNNAITGNDAANTLDGGGGNDTLTGGKGNDVYVVDSTKDVVTETLTIATGGGVDRVESSVTWTLGNNLDDLKLTGAGVIDGTGNTLANALTGNGQNNKLTGLAGNDTIDGGAGQDTLVGGAGNDSLTGGLGTDTAVFAGKSTDYIVTTVGAVTTVQGKIGTAGAADGTDTIVSVELLQFSDGLVTIGKDPVINSPGAGDTALVSLAENIKLATTVTAVDVDTLTFSIIGGADQSAFTIDSLTGALSFKTAPDFENPTDIGADNGYQVIVQVADGNGGFDSQTITVQITDTNEAPDITSGTAFNVAENSIAVTTVAATDPENDKLSFSLVGGADKADFVIDPDTGALSFKTAPDFEDPADSNGDNVYSVIVQVSDGSLTDQQTITVTVTDVDEAPGAVSDKNASANSIAENAADGASVGITAQATDPDGDPVTYSLTNSAGGRFAIDALTGVVTVADGSLLDFETATSHQITVKASSSGGFSTEDFTIAVTNVNEGPGPISDGDGNDNEVTELATNGAAFGITAHAVDPEGTAVTYSLIDDADGRFAIDPTTGVVTVADGLLLDFEAVSSHQITVQASSSGGTSSQSFTINLTDANPETAAGDGAANSFKGGSGADTLGGAGNDDTLSGGGGGDLLVGGAGADDLTGGADADIFEFSFASSAGADRITDFDRTADILRFADVVDSEPDADLDLDDLNAAIDSVSDDGSDVTVIFASGASILFQGVGTGLIVSIDQLVDNAAQIVLTA